MIEGIGMTDREQLAELLSARGALQEALSRGGQVDLLKAADRELELCGDAIRGA